MVSKRCRHHGRRDSHRRNLRRGRVMTGLVRDPLHPDARIHVAGHRGLVGSALWRYLEARGHTALIGRSSAQLDLRNRTAVFDFYAETRPEYVVLAAAKVGGILANATYPADFLSQNLQIHLNVFDAQSSHVLPALIGKFHAAKRYERDEVVLWGTGTPRREFLHVDDLARACVVLLENYDEPMPINVGVGGDVSIRDLAALVARVVGYDGAVRWDTSRPDGTPRKLLNVSRIAALGWRAEIDLQDGIRSTYDWYRRQEQRHDEEAQLAGRSQH